MIESRLEVHRVGSRYPDRRAIASLAPHAHRSEPFGRTFQAKDVEGSDQRLAQRRYALEGRSRQPPPEIAVLQAAADRRHKHDRRRIVVRNIHVLGSDLALRYDGVMRW
jgi:hypothetical protein